VARLLVLLALAFAPAASAQAPPLGSGGAQVWVLRPAGPVKSVVVFLHGWGAMSPEGTAWLDHLRSRGNAVVYPRYQDDVDTPAPATVGGLRDGLRLAFAEPGLRGKPVVAAGYSWGGKLVFDYAVRAREWGVPAPRAVASVFPASVRFGGPPAGRVPATTRVLLMAGEWDLVQSARAYWRWLARHPRTRKQFRIVPKATHGAPMQTTPAAKREFWSRLDALVVRARSS
jgi:pimeloyl-ACP methyl ester carboxylesterase